MTIDRNRIQELLTRFSSQRILVVGDLMLDRFLQGSVSRISPEAPVPVVEVRNEHAMPGGAGNVALNISSLGAESVVAALAGTDVAGDDLIRCLEDRGVSIAGLIRGAHLPTTVKTRVVADRQQVVRVDRDFYGEVPEELIDALCDAVRRETRQSTGVILEDYGKGVVSQRVVDAALSAAREAGIPSGFDPKDNHSLKVEGVTLASPNRNEAFLAAGVKDLTPTAHPLEDPQLLKAGQRLLELWKPRLLMMTLGAGGMLLLQREGGTPMHVPTRAREVFDVSGAGDTVIAAAILALSAGATFEEAAELSNYAGGAVVAKLGTAVCEPRDLLEARL